jgi:hypothetical protein
MKKYMKVGLIGLAAIMALSFGFTAVAAAQSTDGAAETGGDMRQMFAGKLAGILGLDEGQVSDAVEQARQEMREEFQAQRLQTAIDEGLITEEEAGEIQGWWDGRPEAMQQLGQMGRHMGGMRCFK